MPRARLLAVAVVIAAATLAVAPILWRGFPSGDDSSVHYRWVVHYSEALREGQLYPRWLGESNYKQGSPSPIYYPPLHLYVASVLNLLTGSTMLALGLACWLALALSGLAMYRLARLLLTPKQSLVAAALYVLAPYHLFDLYQGTILAEVWSFAWVPLLFYSVLRDPGSDGRANILLIAASYALLLSTHVPLSFVATLILPLVALLAVRGRRRLLEMAAGLALGAGLAAIFLLPVIFERRYVRIGELLRFDYAKFFLFEEFSAALRWDVFAPAKAEHAFLLKTNLIAAGLPILLAATAPFVWRRPAADKRLARAIWVVGAASLLMATSLSRWLWELIPGLSYIQFPFRWLVITTACAVPLAVAAAASAGRNGKARAVGAIVILITVAAGLGVTALAIAQAGYNQEAIKGGLKSPEVPEYRPVWWDQQWREEFALSAAVVTEGDAAVEALDGEGARQKFIVRANAPSTLELRTLYFPGWAARSDGAPVEVVASADGHIQIAVEGGEHTLEVSFQDTRPRLAGKLVSGVSLLVFAGLFFTRRSKRKALGHVSRA